MDRDVQVDGRIALLATCVTGVWARAEYPARLAVGVRARIGTEEAYDPRNIRERRAPRHRLVASSEAWQRDLRRVGTVLHHGWPVRQIAGRDRGHELAERAVVSE